MIYSRFSLPDCAAEILQVFGPQMDPLIQRENALDILAGQAQELSGTRNPSGGYLSYTEYMQAFREDSPIFYPKL